VCGREEEQKSKEEKYERLRGKLKNVMATKMDEHESFSFLKTHEDYCNCK
jgi:hypothetical protein